VEKHMPEWLSELLDVSERQDNIRLKEVNRIRANQMLETIGYLEQKSNELNQFCDEEAKIIEDYRTKEAEKLSKKINWISAQLESFARKSGEKTINLPKGILKLRLGRDKVEIVSLDVFKPTAERFGLMKKIPESSVPDVKAILKYIRARGVPPGVSLTPAKISFKYQTLTNGEPDNDDDNDEEREQAQADAPSGRAGEITAVEK
jgi:hypothetical protein